MGKKGKKKKKIQKKQQQKAMKQRAKKKAMQKKRPATRSQSTEFPGMPGNLPPEVQAKANLMARFAQPLFEMADATDMEEMQNVATLAQVFWEAYQETDLEKRKAKLDELREHYAEVPWATREFDDLTEQLLKRHIYLLSDTHTEEERNRYTREDLEAAMAAEEPAKEKEEVPPLEESDYQIPEFTTEEIFSLLSEDEQTNLSDLFQSIKDNYQDIDFIDENNPVLHQVVEFQEKVLNLFQQYLQHKGISETAATAHSENLKTFFNDFLKDQHNSSMFSFDADHLEEFIVDFYPRKVEANPAQDELLMTSLKSFISFAETLGYLENATPYLKIIDECEEEFMEVLEDYRG